MDRELGVARRFVTGVRTVWEREVLRFLGEKSRIVGAVGQPLLFWLVLGIGIDRTLEFRHLPAGFGYLEYLYTGALGLTLLFTSVYSALSVITDREQGFLKELLIAPVSRESIVIGKILAGTTVAVGQGVVLLIVAPLLGIDVNLVGVLGALTGMLALSFGLTALGVAIAVRMQSTQGFHMIMNFLLLPMWLLSGAVFPLNGLPPILTAIIRVNPVTYGIEALRAGLYMGSELQTVLVQTPYLLSLVALVVFSALCTSTSVRAFRR